MTKYLKVKIEGSKKRGYCLRINESLKNWCFPNWFNKEHFETFLNRKLTDKEFQLLKQAVSEDLTDNVSNLVSDHLNMYADEILEDAK